MEDTKAVGPILMPSKTIPRTDTKCPIIRIITMDILVLTIMEVVGLLLHTEERRLRIQETCPLFGRRCVTVFTAVLVLLYLDFFSSQVSSVQDTLKEYNDTVAQISNLHARSLNNLDDQVASQQLDQAVAKTRKLSNDLKKRIKALQSQGGDSREGQTRRQQV